MRIIYLAPLLVLLASLARAQGSFTLGDAIAQALERHPAQEVATAGVNAAKARVKQAQAGYLPKVNFQESYDRGNNPVFVFSSLLTQHQFGPQNFEIGSLNRPAPLGNFQSLATLDQTIYDGGRTRAAVKSAGLEKGLRQEDQRAAQMNIVAHVARAYYQAIVGAANMTVAEEAVRSAEADLKRAETTLKSGMSTNADVLAIRVHLAAMRERQIQTKYELDSAMAALNDAIGLPLETAHTLTTPLKPATLPADESANVEERAVRERPETRQARLNIDLAHSQFQAAHAAYLPQVSARLAFETDTQEFVQKGGANWLAGVTLRWNLFNGQADSTARQESAFRETAARAGERQADSSIRLEVHRSYNEWHAANERLAVAQDAVGMAEENLRIVRNRYESGLSTVTELLRSELALSETRNRHLQATSDQRNAALNTELAAGTLAAGSPSLQ